MSNGKGREGFTFFELALALFIISLALAIILPSFSGLGESRMTSDAKRIASILRYLNDSSIAIKDTFSVTFDFNNRMVSYQGPEGEKRERFETLSAVELPSKGSVREGELTLFFGPSGAMENITVHLTHDKSTLTVGLNYLSGRVKITEGNA